MGEEDLELAQETLALLGAGWGGSLLVLGADGTRHRIPRQAALDVLRRGLEGRRGARVDRLALGLVFIDSLAPDVLAHGNRAVGRRFTPRVDRLVAQFLPRFWRSRLARLRIASIEEYSTYDKVIPMEPERTNFFNADGPLDGSPSFHYDHLWRGYVELRSLVYFLSGIAIFLVLGVQALETRKWR